MTRKRETLAAMMMHVMTEGRDMVNIIVKTISNKKKGMSSALAVKYKINNQKNDVKKMMRKKRIIRGGTVLNPSPTQTPWFDDSIPWHLRAINCLFSTTP